MTSQQARTLAIKLFGLYAGLRIVFIASGWLSTVIMYTVENLGNAADVSPYSTPNMLGTTLSYAVLLGIYAFVTWLFLAKTTTVANYLFSDSTEDSETIESYQGPYTLAFFITLIVLFYAIPAAAEVITGTVHFGINIVGVDTDYFYYQFWQQFIILVIALIFLNWTRPLEKALTGQNPIEEEDIAKHEDEV